MRDAKICIALAEREITPNFCSKNYHVLVFMSFYCFININFTCSYKLILFYISFVFIINICIYIYIYLIIA